MNEVYLIRKKDLQSATTFNANGIPDNKTGVEDKIVENVDKWKGVESLKIINYPWNIVEPVHISCSNSPVFQAHGSDKSDKDSTGADKEIIYSSGISIPENCVPEMNAKLFYADDRLCVLLHTYEKYPRATFHQINDPVCRDSCQEFFFQPCPEEDSRYFNFELNPWGTYLLGIGNNRYDLVYIDEKISCGQFSIISTIEKIIVNNETKYSWSVEFSIPFSFITKFFKNFRPYPGKVIRANFYKCGDDTIHPHFGCWNKVVNDTPDFHRPECFGTLIME